MNSRHGMMLSDQQLFGPWLALVGVQLLLVTIHITLRGFEEFQNEVLFKYEWQNQMIQGKALVNSSRLAPSRRVLFYVGFAYNMLLASATVFLSFMLRKVPSKYQEVSRNIPNYLNKSIRIAKKQ